jgi:hypothetical protein
MRTYNVRVGAEVEDEGAGRRSLALAEEVHGDGDLQRAAGHTDHRRGHHVPFPGDPITHARTTKNSRSVFQQDHLSTELLIDQVAS